jgi:cold shock CspA family protein
MNGIIKRFDAKRGFGFIQSLAGGGPDVLPIYFHITAVCQPEKGFLPALPIGCEVRFDLCRSDRGAQAANVRLVVLSGATIAQPLAVEEQLMRFRDRSRAKSVAKGAKNVVQ